MTIGTNLCPSCGQPAANTAVRATDRAPRNFGSSYYCVTPECRVYVFSERAAE